MRLDIFNALPKPAVPRLSVSALFDRIWRSDHLGEAAPRPLQASAHPNTLAPSGWGNGGEGEPLSAVMGAEVLK